MSRGSILHGPSMFADKAKIYGVVFINSPALSLLMKHLVIGQRLKTPNFSAFHWSLRGCLVSIGQHFVATRVVHLPKRTETSLITESDQSRANQQLLQICTVRTAWSDSDQVVQAVHSCKSWYWSYFDPLQPTSPARDMIYRVHNPTVKPVILPNLKKTIMQKMCL